MIKRVYVEKKPGYGVEAEGLYRDIKENLEIHALESLRVLNRYDVEGLSEEVYRACLQVIFAEPPADMVYEEYLDAAADSFVFAVQYLPGQYDQRADSAMQCIQIMSLKGKEEAAQEPFLVVAAKVYVLQGKFTEAEKEKIKSYCINPVESMEAPLEKPDSLGLKTQPPEPVKIHRGFTRLTDEQVRALGQELGMAMSGEDLLHCRQYFGEVEKRDPSATELRVIDTYWSDHCRHTTFLTEIEEAVFDKSALTAPIERAYALYREESGRTTTFMDIATTGMRALRRKGFLDDLDESDEINACSICVDVEVDGKKEPWLVMFKNETHNHPTEIEPFGGAATCLGGAIRDPLSGRSYVYQAMRVTGSGDPRRAVQDTLPGKLPQSKITTVAAAGYSAYGNQVGIATGKVAEIYDEGYVAKRMEIGAVVGAAPKNRVIRKKPTPGDLVILVGGRTGRDGCGGAAGSSQAHQADTILTCGAQVQKGNPPTERKLQRLFRNQEAAGLIKRCNDFGAGGVCVAIGELAEGLTVDLDKVPKKYEGLDGTELAISESQERMAVVVAKEDAEAFISHALVENLEATVVAAVTEDRRLVMRWQGQEIVNIARDFLDTNGAKQRAKVRVVCPEAGGVGAATSCRDGNLLTETLGELNVAAQKGLGERFDATIGAGTVLMPFGGVNQLTPIEAMVAKIPVEEGETETVTCMAYGYDPKLSAWSPFHGAVYAVVESIAKIIATGGSYERVRLSFQEYFERLGDQPERWGKPFASLLGGFYAQMMLEIPAIGGKDSMSGTFSQGEDRLRLDVPPTLVSFALGIGQVETIISPEFKKAGSTLILLKTGRDAEALPDFERLKRNFNLVHTLIKEKKIISAATVGVGGVGAAAAKMTFGNGIGAELVCEDLYCPGYGDFLLEWDGTEEEATSRFSGTQYEVLGKTLTEKILRLNGAETTLNDALGAWMTPLEKIFPTGYFEQAAEITGQEEGKEPLEARTGKTSDRAGKTSGTGCAGVGLKIAKPRVLIPVFPGTNCEYDTARAFEKAGAETDIFVIGNLTVGQLEESILELQKRIGRAQIIALPGGFSAGDEPDGSGKFIAAVFRNHYVTEAVRELLQKRDGLMLGICNGFQALIKLGLVPYGDIVALDENCPTLTYNAIGRHISCLARTKILSNHSPWLWGTETGAIHHVAVSHGEGRFAAAPAQIKQLQEAGQIATVYVDALGQPSMDIRHNPNGSDFAVEGLVSPDGRVFGKMGHSERVGRGLYKNVTKEEETRQEIFAAGVQYFG